MKSGDDADSLSGTDRYLIVLGKTAGGVEPGQGVFYNPTFGLDLPLRFDAH